MQKFPTILVGQIRMMEGEEFHITLVEEAVSFCVKTPQSVLICILREANSRTRVALGARQYWGKVFVVTPVSISLAYLSISLASPIYNANYRSH